MCYGIHWTSWHPLHFPLPQWTSARLHCRIPCITRLVSWPFLICPKCLVPLDGTLPWPLSLFISFPILYQLIILMVSILVSYAFLFRFHSYCYVSWQTYVKVKGFTYSEGGAHKEMLHPQVRLRLRTRDKGTGSQPDKLGFVRLMLWLHRTRMKKEKYRLGEYLSTTGYLSRRL